MAGHRNFNELRAGLAEKVGEEKLAAGEAAATEDYERFEQRLGDVRKARNLTQVQLARALEVTQSQVSRIESQTDLYLSTLATYIEAMGGELELTAVFDDTRERVPLTIAAAPRTSEHPGAVMPGDVVVRGPDDETVMVLKSDPSWSRVGVKGDLGLEDLKTNRGGDRRRS